MAKKICIATSTRADWGILKPLAAALRDAPGVEVQILATNMHLLERYGHTADEIIADGFEITARVEMPDPEGSALQRACAMGDCLSGCAREFDRLRPDAIVILGDRFEMLAVAAAAAVMRIPIVHIAGGETTEGAIDNAMRHAISQLAALHLVSAEPYRQKVVQLGANPANVINTGSLGVWNMLNQPYMPLDQLAESVGFDPAKPFAVATFHPATLDNVDAGLRCREMLEALDQFPDIFVIVTYPNNDTGSDEIIEAIENWAARNRHRASIVKSLGLKRYLSAIRKAEFVIGNSSSGIIEVPSVGTPAINIGIRQQGRLHGDAVIDCGDSTAEIASAIRQALSPQFKAMAKEATNPYFSPDTLGKSVNAILQFIG